MTKTTSVTVTGTIERCDLRQGPHPDPYRGRYSPNSEYYSLCLDIALRLDDGTAVYFKTPGGEMCVANCPGAAIVHYNFDGTSGDWMRESNPDGGSRVATAERTNANTVEPTVKVGDRITISGRVKAERTSKAGHSYRVLNYVKLRRDS